MSFRARMILFFLIIVVIPMIAVALVLSILVAESEVGRADSELAEGLGVAVALYEQSREGAVDNLRDATQDERIRAAFSDGGSAQLEQVVREVARGSEAVVAVALFGSARDSVGMVGTDAAIAYATANPAEPDGTPIGRIALSTTTATEYALALARLTGLEARVVRDGAVLASTLSGGDADGFVEGGDAGPLATTIEVGGEEFRGRYTTARDAVGDAVHVGVFQEAEPVAGSIADSRTLVGAILLGFLLLALASSVLIVRSLGRQIDRFLGAARAVGRGDFDARVPVEGRDEFGALGREFNKMSEQLKQNLGELERRRREREEAIRRIGEAFAAGLDRDGIARLAARAAMEACSAEAARVILGELDAAAPVPVGDNDPMLLRALEDAERHVREAGDGPVPVAHGTAYALAAALRGPPVAGGQRRRLGYLAIARRDTVFDASERELFAYLAAQASVSLDNAGLHQTVQAQAITDPLTGLHNRRYFDAALNTEIGRIRRFGGEVGLVMIDLDGFKPVNDVHGHQAGDRVLVELAELMQGLTRDVDQLARYGGDEIAIILPQTDLAGSELLAERIRAGVESLRVTVPGVAEPISLTGSFGTASLPEAAADQQSLIAAADSALYRAKRAGGNRVTRAEPVAVPR